MNIDSWIKLQAELSAGLGVPVNSNLVQENSDWVNDKLRHGELLEIPKKDKWTGYEYMVLQYPQQVKEWAANVGPMHYYQDENGRWV